MELRQVERSLTEPFIAAMERTASRLTQLEVRLQHFHRMLDGHCQVAPHFVRRAVRIAE